jgi:hypothetical protein
LLDPLCRLELTRCPVRVAFVAIDNPEIARLGIPQKVSVCESKQTFVFEGQCVPTRPQSFKHILSESINRFTVGLIHTSATTILVNHPCLQFTQSPIRIHIDRHWDGNHTRAVVIVL